MGSGLLLVPKRYFRMPQQAQAFIAKVEHYQVDIANAITKGISELGMAPEEVKGKRILFKPNLVETAASAPITSTHILLYCTERLKLSFDSGRLQLWWLKDQVIAAIRWRSMKSLVWRMFSRKIVFHFMI